MPSDPRALLRSRAYLRLLVVAAILGAPVSAAAYGFLALVNYLQPEIFIHLPHGLGFRGEPWWWPLPVLAVGGLLTGLAIRYLPGTGGARPAEGFKVHKPPTPADLPGIILAALATLCFGAVLGPEAPLIAIGGGLVVLALRAARRNMPAQGVAELASAGSFAAISTLFGSPILGAFLLMEASGLGGPMMGVVLVPGLLAAGVGSLVFVGLNAWTGLGTFSLAIPGLPPFGEPTIGEFGWALVIGVAAALLGSGIRWLGLLLQPYSIRRPPLAAVVAGLIVAGLAIAYAEGTGKASSEVLFSGQSALGPLIANSASYSVGALALLLACKALAYGVSLSSFRGGPTFPALFVGAAGGILMSHLPGLALVAGVAMGIGAMSVVMLGLPLTSVLLATVLLFSDGLRVMPLVIVAVVVAYVTVARIQPPAQPEAEPAGHTDPAAAAAPGAASAVPPQAGPPSQGPPSQGPPPAGPASAPGPGTRPRD
ncbi:chloride channel protein [Trebonia kvetii]|uniref:Chloride channel protein n=1 Tax=Trebonia kvetii TaxID=2480626 RepID=A0A6P2C025_9ACTN|nr:chloride channel protein [Trebonia kvetii]TVZ02773.1 chloride channel protein [Trebonia kvetii]